MLSTHKPYQLPCRHTNPNNYPVYTQTIPITLSTHEPYQLSFLHTNHTSPPVSTQTVPIILSTHKPYQLPCLRTNHTSPPVYTVTLHTNHTSPPVYTQTIPTTLSTPTPYLHSCQGDGVLVAGQAPSADCPAVSQVVGQSVELHLQVQNRSHPALLAMHTRSVT